MTNYSHLQLFPHVFFQSAHQSFIYSKQDLYTKRITRSGKIYGACGTRRFKDSVSKTYRVVLRPDVLSVMVGAEFGPQERWQFD